MLKLYRILILRFTIAPLFYENFIATDIVLTLFETHIKRC
jgi:hypothetical protein